MTNDKAPAKMKKYRVTPGQPGNHGDPIDHEAVRVSVVEFGPGVALYGFGAEEQVQSSASGTLCDSNPDPIWFYAPGAWVKFEVVEEGK